MKKAKLRLRTGYQRIPHAFVPKLLKLPGIGYPEVILLMTLMPYFPKCFIKGSVIMKLARIKARQTYTLRIGRLVESHLIERTARPGRTTIYKPGMRLLRIYQTSRPPVFEPFRNRRR